MMAKNVLSLEENGAPEIFISYSRKDLDFVTRLHTDLTDHGLKAWFDQNNIVVGDQWPQAIVQGIKGCQIFLIVLSPDSTQSDNVRKELDLAAKYERKIISYCKSRIQFFYVNL